MVVIDTVASSLRVPLWKFIGGASNTITTDITIPIVSSAEAAEFASKYYKQGFKTLKLKVGKNMNANIKVLQSIRDAHPECQFILDANEGYNSDEAVEVLEKLLEMGLAPILFEQPVHKDDWDGLGYMSNIAREKYGVFVAADESNTVKDRNELMEIHIPIYLSSISKGVAIVMVSYSIWNGMNMHTHDDLITGFLKKNTLHFQGFVILDYEGSKSADSAAVTIATNMAGRGTNVILGGNAEFMERVKLREILMPIVVKLVVDGDFVSVKNPPPSKTWKVNEKLFPCQLSNQNTELTEKAMLLTVKTWGKRSLTELEKVESFMTLEQILKKSFCELTERLKSLIKNLYTHLPKSFNSVATVKELFQALVLLRSIGISLYQAKCKKTLDAGEKERIPSCFLPSSSEIDECLKTLSLLSSSILLSQLKGRNQIEIFCLSNVYLILCTISSSIQLYTEGMTKRLVIDEAAQLKECESKTILLQLQGLQHCILIGDENQLPALVKSKIADSTFLRWLQQMGKQLLYGIFGEFCLLAVVFVKKYILETKGKSLQEIEVTLLAVVFEFKRIKVVLNVENALKCIYKDDYWKFEQISKSSKFKQWDPGKSNVATTIMQFKCYFTTLRTRLF